MARWQKYLIAILGSIVLTCFMSIILVFLWNWTMPEIFNLPQINYWQSLGLIIISNILFNKNSNSEKYK